MKGTRIKLELAVFGELLEPKQFSSLIGIESTSSWYEGDLIPNNKHSLRRKETAWDYTIDFIETLNIEDVTKKFNNLFPEKGVLIKQDFLCYLLKSVTKNVPLCISTKHF